MNARTGQKKYLTHTLLKRTWSLNLFLRYTYISEIFEFIFLFYQNALATTTIVINIQETIKKYFRFTILQYAFINFNIYLRWTISDLVICTRAIATALIQIYWGTGCVCWPRLDSYIHSYICGRRRSVRIIKRVYFIWYPRAHNLLLLNSHRRESRALYKINWESRAWFNDKIHCLFYV